MLGERALIPSWIVGYEFGVVGELESMIIAPVGGDVRAQDGWVDVAARAEVLVVLEVRDSELKDYNSSAMFFEGDHTGFSQSA